MSWRNNFHADGSHWCGTEDGIDGLPVVGVGCDSRHPPIRADGICRAPDCNQGAPYWHGWCIPHYQNKPEGEPSS